MENDGGVKPMRSIDPTPERAVGPDGAPEYGVFRSPLRRVNLEDLRLNRVLRYSRLKEWHHVGLVHPEVYVSLAAVDLKYLTASWVFVHDRVSGLSFEHERKLPGRRLVLPAEIWDARWTLEGGAGYRLEMHNHLTRGVHEIRIDVRRDGGRAAVQARLTLNEDLGRIHPLVAMLPLGRNRPLYTHKVPCPVEGTLIVGEQSYTFDRERDLALLDVHKAYYPRKTFWRWATFASMAPDGTIRGVNLTHNVVQSDDRHNENALWDGERLHLLGAARFDIPEDPRATWRIRTLDDLAELEFRPAGERREDTNLLVAKSWYRQPVGFYSGTVRDGRDGEFRFEDVWGIAEDHRVTW